MTKFFAAAIIALMLFPPHGLTETLTYSCKYTSYSDEDGNYKTKEDFDLLFIVDIETGKSYMSGKNGTNPVEMLEKNKQISFLEATKTGNLMLTTIDESMKSVHSRNTVVYGALVPSQYYGDCTKK